MQRQRRNACARAAYSLQVVPFYEARGDVKPSSNTTFIEDTAAALHEAHRWSVKALRGLVCCIRGVTKQYGDTVCSCCVNRTFHFYVGGGPCDRDSMQQTAQQSVCGINWCALATTLIARSRSISLSVRTKLVCAIEIHQQLIKVTGDDEMRAQCVIKWQREFENGRMDGQQQHRTDVTAAAPDRCNGIMNGETDCGKPTDDNWRLIRCIGIIHGNCKRRCGKWKSPICPATDLLKTGTNIWQEHKCAGGRDCAEK